MFAGLSFLTRTMKHFCEKFNIGNLSEGDITSESFDDKELIEAESQHQNNPPPSNNDKNINNP